MIFKEITSKDIWEQKTSSQPQTQFLQSWDWGEFQKSLGRQIWRLDLGGVYALAIKMPLPLEQNYLYVPRLNFLLDRDMINILKELAQSEKSIFLRLELGLAQDLDLFGFRKTNNVQPGQTLFLDLSKSEDDLLAEMRQKIRYNIRLAFKKGVKVREGNDNELEIFYNLMSNTFERKGKKFFSKEYYQKILENLPFAKIYLAELSGKILCANMVLFYGNTVTYLHGGSSPEDKNIMAPHLLQWEIIKKAKELGYKYYDFWGIDEVKWPGVTRFKKGFGGFEVKYGNTYDSVLNKFWYTAYQIVKKFK